LLAAAPGSSILVHAKGVDAPAAMAAVQGLVESKFYED
jgi:phosphotransferase system HPr-like phosphotransfer protein